MGLLSARAVVPCGACSACCRFRVTPVGHEELAREHYAAEVVDSGGPLGRVWALKRTADGACVYLEEGRCSIWERAPAVCRTFDCRKEYARRPRPERRRMARSSTHWKAVFAAALEHLAPKETVCGP